MMHPSTQIAPTDGASSSSATFDPCRTCDGTGTVREPTERGTWIAEDCYDCRGTGSRYHILKNTVAHGTGGPVLGEYVPPERAKAGSFQCFELAKERAQSASLLRSHPEQGGY